MPLLDNDKDISVLVEGLDHPEGIAWGMDGYAYAGGEAGQVYRIDVESREVFQLAHIPGGFILGMALDSDHNIYACDSGNHCVQRITKGGAFSTYSTGPSEEPLRFPNYPAFDSSGNLYVSMTHTNTSIFAEARIAGRLATDPPNTMSGSWLLREGEVAKSSGRWGDYLGAAVDPSDPSCVWVVGQYAKDTAVFDWGTYIGATSYDGGCATPKVGHPGDTDGDGCSGDASALRRGIV